MGDINKLIRQLVNYGLDKELIVKDDEMYTINRILEVLKLDEYIEPQEVPESEELEDRKSTRLNSSH